MTAITQAQVIRLGPRVDVTTVSELRRDIHAALDASSVGDLLVDLEDVSVLDAAGLGMLVAAHRKAALAGRRLILTSVPPGVGRVLAVTRLYRVFRLDRAAVAGGALAAAHGLPT